MKKHLLALTFVCCIPILMTSCFTYTYTVGKGAQTGATVKAKNHYFIYGLAQGKQSNAQEMVGDLANYSVTVKHTFIDGLINAITFGIYNPTTTTVQK